jgi:hypothetical protein
MITPVPNDGTPKAPLDRAEMNLRQILEHLDGARDTADAQFDNYAAGEGDAENYSETLVWLRMIKKEVILTLAELDLARAEVRKLDGAADVPKPTRAKGRKS